jgi:histidinol-phosphate phosphatase family protein
MAVTATPAVFFDKDGTLVEDVPYNVDPAKVRLAQGAAASLARVCAAGYRAIVVSNQSGVARGLFDEAALDPVSERVATLAGHAGGRIDGFYYCPHHPDGVRAEFARACACRKPAPGLLRRAACEHGIDLGRSWLVGDILDDVEAGRAAGCRSVLLDTGAETVWQRSPEREPHYVAGSLAEATTIILGEGGR